MPELPEVETVVRELNESQVVGLKITHVKVFWPKTIANISPSEFEHSVRGQTIERIFRRAKFIVFKLSNMFLMIHLRMSGRLQLLDKTEAHSPYERVCLQISNNQELRFVDTRKFGRMYLIDDLSKFFSKYGPEPLDPSFTWQKLKSIISNRSVQLKMLLLNQSFIAGLGNIYVDEALWLAKLHPLRKANTLTDKEIQSLFNAIQTALQMGLKSNGATLGSGKTNFYRLDGSQGRYIYQLNVFRQTGKKCKNCGTAIVRIKAAGRSTHICSSCQQV